MILIDKENITEGAFTSLLEVTKSEIIKQYSKNVPKIINGNRFDSSMLVTTGRLTYKKLIAKTK